MPVCQNIWELYVFTLSKVLHVARTVSICINTVSSQDHKDCEKQPGLFIRIWGAPCLCVRLGLRRDDLGGVRWVRLSWVGLGWGSRVGWLYCWSGWGSCGPAASVWGCSRATQWGSCRTGLLPGRLSGGVLKRELCSRVTWAEPHRGLAFRVLPRKNQSHTMSRQKRKGRPRFQTTSRRSDFR